MRAKQTQWVILAVTLLTMTGCKTGSPGWSWNRKGAANAATPPLPSASATPAGTPNHGYANHTPPGGGSPYPDPNVAPPSPYAGSPYAGAPSPYATAAASPAAAAPTAPGASPYAVAASPPTAYSAPPAAPQVGPYNENVAAPPAMNAYAAAPPSGTVYPSTGATAPPPAGAAPGATATTTPPGGYGGAYGNGGGAETAAPAADGRYADRYATTAEPPVTDRYAAGDTNTTDPNANAMANRYQPGSTAYAPGQTGYNPPGVAPYQSPAQTNVAGAGRRDPYYRPGGTGDYVLGGGAQTPAATVADRYGAPAGGTSGESGATLPPR